MFFWLTKEVKIGSVTLGQGLEEMNSECVKQKQAVTFSVCLGQSAERRRCGEI